MPELNFIDRYYLDWYNRLEASRQVGMGVGRIPLGEILNVCDRLHEDDSFVELMLACDSAFMEEYSEEQKKKSKAK